MVTQAQERLEYLRVRMRNSEAGNLYKNAKSLVFGDGDPSADLMIVGEAPGYDEDQEGIPFVGRSGRLLNKMLQKAQIKRQSVYTTNIVKRRPPDNRDPTPDEIESSLPWLHAQIALVRPLALLTLGRIASNVMVGMEKEPISSLREKKDLLYHNEKTHIDIPIVATYHPAYVLRQLQHGPNTLHITFRDLRRAVKLSRQNKL